MTAALSDINGLDEIRSSIRNKYGELLTLEEVAELFKYRTVGAVRKAHSRGTLPVALYRFPNRTGYYAKANEAAKSIESMSLSNSVPTSHKSES